MVNENPLGQLLKHKRDPSAQEDMSVRGLSYGGQSCAEKIYHKIVCTFFFTYFRVL